MNKYCFRDSLIAVSGSGSSMRFSANRIDNVAGLDKIDPSAEKCTCVRFSSITGSFALQYSACQPCFRMDGYPRNGWERTFSAAMAGDRSNGFLNRSLVVQVPYAVFRKLTATGYDPKPGQELDKYGYSPVSRIISGCDAAPPRGTCVEVQYSFTANGKYFYLTLL